MFRHAATIRLVCAAWIPCLFAQGAADSPKVEVASVRRVMPGAKGFGPEEWSGRPGTSSPNRIVYSNVTLRGLLMAAYGAKAYRIIAPAWVDEERYAISANLPVGADVEALHLMLQNLAIERFRMTVRREQRKLPCYELAVRAGGPKMQESPHDSRSETKQTVEADGTIKTTAKRRSMVGLAQMIENLVDRPVFDATGLQGFFDFELRFAPDPGMRTLGGVMPPVQLGLPAPSAGAGGPDVFVAVKELGLHLNSRARDIEVFVIEQAERVPIEN